MAATTRGSTTSSVQRGRGRGWTSRREPVSEEVINGTPSSSNRILCKFGYGCQFLATNSCRFYHPPASTTSPLVGESSSSVITTSSSDTDTVETEIGVLSLWCPSEFRHLVVHCKKQRFDVYCGRKNPTMPAIDGKYHYGNPFKMTIEE